MTIQLRTKATDMTNTTARARTGGIARGSMILTARGEVAVEDLRTGDKIITRDRGMVELRGITRRALDAVKAFRIRPDSLGLGRPERDVILAPGQHVYLRDWRAQALFGADAALVPAWRLADGTFVSEQETAAMVLFELHFDAEHVLYVNGMEIGSGKEITKVIAAAA